AEKSAILEEIGLSPKDYFLATLHRQSNTDNETNLANTLDAFSALGITVVFPSHPRTVKFIEKHNLGSKVGKNVIIIKTSRLFGFSQTSKERCEDIDRFRRNPERGIFPEDSMHNAERKYGMG
ncbi:MAG: UDP-N-acetylglucosamine 2-epimerase, partial [Thermoplasmatota archaeon]